MKLPDMPRTGFLVREFAVQVVRYLRSITIVGITGGTIKQGPNGTTIQITIPSPTVTGGSRTDCPFGEIITWTDGEGEEGVTKYGIRGGVIYCGDQNWNITRHELNVDTDGNWLISIPVDVIVNRDDDNEIILPGIKTGTKPDDSDWDQTEITEEGDEDYPENEEPEVSDGAGKIYIPIGTLTIKDGIPSLAKVACGNIRIDQCGGVLSHTRG